MATISENLQTIKNSVSAIKQAISDKGGDVSGDISTWASAISGISGGGGSSTEITFTGSIARSSGGMDEPVVFNITGYISSTLDIVAPSLVAIFIPYSQPSIARIFISNVEEQLTLSLNTNVSYDMVMPDKIPILYLASGADNTIYPVTFIQQTPIKFYVNDIEYDALYPMTWEQFINSETYNPTLTDINGDSYKAFLIENNNVNYSLLDDGELDTDSYLYRIDNSGDGFTIETPSNIIKENMNYLCN